MKLKPCIASNDGGNFTAAIEKALNVESAELLKAVNQEGSTYKPVLGSLYLRFVNAIRKEVNTLRMAPNGAGTRVSQNYIIDALANEGNEEVQYTEEQRETIGLALKRYLGVKGFVSASEVETGIAMLGQWHLNNLRNAVKGTDKLFSDDVFNATFENALTEPVNVEVATAPVE